MRKQIEKIIATAFVFLLCLTAFNFRSLAYSEIPDYFDFEQCCVSMDAGSTMDLWIRATYDYDAYVGDHTSTKTFIECSEKQVHSMLFFTSVLMSRKRTYSSTST